MDQAGRKFDEGARCLVHTTHRFECQRLEFNERGEHRKQGFKIFGLKNCEHERPEHVRRGGQGRQLTDATVSPGDLARQQATPLPDGCELLGQHNEAPRVRVRHTVPAPTYVVAALVDFSRREAVVHERQDSRVEHCRHGGSTMQPLECFEQFLAHRPGPVSIFLELAPASVLLTLRPNSAVGSRSPMLSCRARSCSAPSKDRDGTALTF